FHCTYPRDRLYHSLRYRTCPDHHYVHASNSSAPPHPYSHVYIMRGRHFATEIRPQQIVHAFIARIAPRHYYGRVVVESKYVFRLPYFDLISCRHVQRRHPNELRLSLAVQIAVCVYLEPVVKPHPTEACAVFVVLGIAIGETEQLVGRVLIIIGDVIHRRFIERSFENKLMCLKCFNVAWRRIMLTLP